jgi:putative membrane-bound dehydrogenase-like protein
LNLVVFRLILLCFSIRSLAGAGLFCQASTPPFTNPGVFLFVIYQTCFIPIADPGTIRVCVQARFTLLALTILHRLATTETRGGPASSPLLSKCGSLGHVVANLDFGSGERKISVSYTSTRNIESIRDIVSKRVIVSLNSTVKLGAFQNASWVLLSICLISIASTAEAWQADETRLPKAPYDSEKNFEQPPMDPTQAAKSFSFPDGFQMSLFAAEPDVRQPIAVASDERGRLWVAENYTYAERELNFDESLQDRIIILEDTDGDGKADRRKVFWDKAYKLTSIELGQGGLWALCAPHLLFLPDRDGDDVIDGEPIVVLDGWDENAVRHNVVNGLRWGPDGWLYGRHGILATSLVGRPGTPRESRVPLNCGIWRYHPQRDLFEVVATGTTNPWGMDWSEDGELFFINTVIGHLWHAVSGSHYERMYGGDFNPHWYKLLPQIADHVHWNTEEAWSDIRQEFTKETDQAGGGHAHIGLLIYQEDQWPVEYQGNVYTLNLHGRRINRDRLQRSGSSFVAEHEPDFAFAADPWFRGIDLIAGPQGQVWIADWSDTGECHENDGVHRSSGRIYQLSFPEGSVGKNFEGLADVTLDELTQLALDGPEWYVRQARRQLVERYGHLPEDDSTRQTIVDRLQATLQSEGEALRRLRSLWILYQFNAIPTDRLIALVGDPSPVLRRWAVRLLGDQAVTSPQVITALETCVAGEEDGLVLTYLASTLQRLPASERWGLAQSLASTSLAHKDQRLQMLIWYGIEPSVASEPAQVGPWLTSNLPPYLIEWTIRRLAVLQSDQPAALDQAVAATGGKLNPDQQVAFLQGLSQGFKGARNLEPPMGWNNWTQTLAHPQPANSRLALAEVEQLFGEGRGEEALMAIARDGQEELAVRKQALVSLGESRSEAARELLLQLLTDRDLAGAALRALRYYEDEAVAKAIVDRFPNFRPDDAPTAIATLCARDVSARLLLLAIQQGKIGADWVAAYEWRQLLALEQADVTQAVYEIWPQSRDWGDLVSQKQRVQGLLTEQRLARADLDQGALLFQKNCANCHRLLGQGSDVGPDLTGGQRDNLNYLIQNIVSPSEEVATNYRTSLFQMADGQVIVGVVLNQLPDRLMVQTKEGQVTLLRSEIEERKESSNSLMPNGLLAPLSDDEVVDLLGYLQRAGKG